MKMATPFEIKVALLGNVSAGKSTVLNALLKDKYSEVAMKRTTACVNYFAVFKKPPTEEEEVDGSSDDTEEEAPEAPDATKADNGTPATAPQGWTNLAENPRTAESTHEEISADNRTKLSADSPTVQEKYFEVELDRDLVEMRSDTKLVLVDVPGLNEAGAAFDQYKSFVRDQWHTFDCVVLVMDAKQGVNTHDQVFLLRFVKELLSSKKKVPVIVLCNKVDDPEDEEQAEMVNEARAEVEQIFEVSDRKEALRVVLQQNEKPGAFVFGSGGSLSPAFIPISAINGYIQLSASRMTLEKFASFDRDLIEKLGREQIGRRRWTKLSEEEKVKEVYEIITNPEDGDDVVNESNFNSFLGALSFFVGGEKTQTDLLKNQLNASGEMLLTEPYVVGRSSRLLKSLIDRWMNLFDGHCRAELERDFFQGRPSMLFWQHYDSWENLAFQNFKSSWKESKPQSSMLAQPMKELLSYYEFVHSSGTENTTEKQKILLRMKQLVCRFFDILLRETTKVDGLNSGNDFKKLSPYDLSLVFESVLLMAHNQTFCEDFGSQIVQLRAHMPDGRGWISENFDGTSLCPACTSEMKLGIGPQFHNVMTCSNPVCSRQLRFNTVRDDGKVVERLHTSLFGKVVEQPVKKLRSEWLELTHSASGDGLPKYPSMYGKLVKIRVPSSLSDPSHFGHLPWLYCQLKSAIEDGLACFKKLLASVELGRDEDPKTETIFTFDAVTISGSTSLSSQPDYQTLLTKFYQKHDPSKVKSVPKLLEKYKGREKEMCAKLAQKYRVANLLDEAAQSTPTMPANLGSSIETSSASTPFSSTGGNTLSASPFGSGGSSSSSLLPGAQFSSASSWPWPSSSPFGTTIPAPAPTIFGSTETKAPSIFVSTNKEAKPATKPKSATTFPPMPTKAPSIFGAASMPSSESKSASSFPPMPTTAPSIFSPPAASAPEMSSSLYPPMPTKDPPVFGLPSKTTVSETSTLSFSFPSMPSKAPLVFGSVPSGSSNAAMSFDPPPSNSTSSSS